MRDKIDKLNELREEIDFVDSELLRLLNDRYSLVSRIGLIKNNLKLPVEDINREKEILNSLELGCLDRQFVEDLYQVIFSYFKKLQSTE